VPFVAEVRIFAGSLPPAGWAFCDGQIMPISQNTALFSLLGWRFGGDGQSTFALPDLRGRTPIGPGQGPGLTLRGLSESLGAETHVVTEPEAPSHTHAVRAGAANGTSDAPAGHLMARAAAGIPHYGTNADASLGAQAIGSNGSSQPHNNMQPYLTLNYIIALQGQFPPHS
jgi:microcystin-dependent protein